MLSALSQQFGMADAFRRVLRPHRRFDAEHLLRCAARIAAHGAEAAPLAGNSMDRTKGSVIKVGNSPTAV
ncbi:hypothetical protein [Caballeronia calidae]|uniref:hypothetical protein n=1 Tax=Caballeronia calidae TaxID=1777139 RepID=UPI0012FD37ED|nr:hypothetical protein [Caballeronia calidae]